MLNESNYQCRIIDRDVFRAYDIRGIIGKQLDENAFYTIGRAIASRLKMLERSSIFLARDGRLTSKKLAQALMHGLLESGINVLDLGEVSTPIMYFATHVEDVDNGLIVTGSHNPSEYNGIKMVLAGKTLVSKDIQELYEVISTRQFTQGKGQYQSFDIIEKYLKRVVKNIHLTRPMKVVVDCGNGIGGPFVPRALEALGCEIIPLYCDVDGSFPNHHPDPSVESNLTALKKAIVEHQADIGLAFDGDADRLGVLTNKCELIWPDRLMMVYAQDVLQRNPGATIVYDVKCSSHVASVITEAGGIAKMCPTGHSIVKKIMKQESSVLAGEMSGHLFFNDTWYGFDDALYSACRLLEILSRSTLSVSEQFLKVPNSVNTPEIKIPIVDDKKFQFMESFCRNATFPNARVITIDGLRVEFEHGWGLIRASNTTPCLVARFEAKDHDSLNTIRALFKTELQAIDNELEIPF